jgi:two-component system, OmpR family, KDP operon response regulator KdpE
MNSLAHTFPTSESCTGKFDYWAPPTLMRTSARHPHAQVHRPIQVAGDILVIEGQLGTLEQLRELFGGTELNCWVTTSGPEGLRLLYERRPQLVLLSLVLPGMDGWETFGHIRDLSDVPVILLANSANDEIIERGLDAGAVDVIVKPFAGKVLLARVRAALRTAHPQPVAENGFTDAHLRLDADRQLVFVQGVEVKLTSTERKLLFFLFDHGDQICTFDQILEHVWGWEYGECKQYVHIYISRLRQRIESDPKQPHYLLTEHGVGYQFRRRRLE